MCVCKCPLFTLKTNNRIYSPLCIHECMSIRVRASNEHNQKRVIPAWNVTKKRRRHTNVTRFSVVWKIYLVISFSLFLFFLVVVLQRKQAEAQAESESGMSDYEMVSFLPPDFQSSPSPSPPSRPKQNGKSSVSNFIQLWFDFILHSAKKKCL